MPVAFLLSSKARAITNFFQAGDTIGGFNAFIEKQKQVEGDTLVTVALFDDKYEILWNGLDINKARLTGKEYYVRGCTSPYWMLWEKPFLMWAQGCQ
ncbi:MAG: hypothetical protein Q7J85_08275 [Bacillota bacterium]|nr:hypothetical protein [Bacillota bacterium]